MDINAYMRAYVNAYVRRRHEVWMQHYVFFAEAHERGGYS